MTWLKTVIYAFLNGGVHKLFPIAIGVVLACILIYTIRLIYLIRNHRISHNHSIYKLLFVAYLIVVLYCTCLGREQGRLSYKSELFWSWKDILIHHRYDVVSDNIINLGMLVPLGFLSYFIHHHDGSKKYKKMGCVLIRCDRFKHYQWWKATLWCGLLSCFIEGFQLVFRVGMFEWDDIVHNAIGGTVGYVIAAIYVRIHRKCKARCEKQRSGESAKDDNNSHHKKHKHHKHHSHKHGRHHH